MLRFDPATITLGTRNATPVSLTWTADNADDTPLWGLSYLDADNTFTLRNETGDTATTPLEVTTDDETRVTDLRVTGEVADPLTLAGVATTVSGFDSNSEHWLYGRDGDASDDTLLGISRLATGDYNLLVSEGGTTSRVLTTSDEGSLDAGTLDGASEDLFLYRDSRRGLTNPLKVGTYGIDGDDGSSISFEAAGTANTIQTDASGGGWVVWNSANSEPIARFDEQSNLEVPNGNLTVGGNSVLTTATDVGWSANRSDGTVVVDDVDAMVAGTDLSFSDSGGGGVTIAYSGNDGGAMTAGQYVTAAGDGSQTSFTLPHNGAGTTAPVAADVTPTTEDASADLWVTNITASDVTIEYAAAPPGDGSTNNLGFYVTVTDDNMRATSVSDSGTTILTGVDDLNFGRHLAVADDGDNTVTIDAADTLATTDTAETLSATWQYENGLGVTANADVAYTNSSHTTQFAHRYDSTDDAFVLSDAANATQVYGVDRAGVLDFKQTPTINGTQIATTADDLANSGSGSAAANEVATADGAGNTVWKQHTAGSSVTASGDGSSTTVTLPHDLGETPAQAFVQPRSKAAMGDFRVSNKTSSDVAITYHSPPPDGTDNLDYDLIVRASGV